uniref:(California timema) hypothetical protein n=1 Tax=Timema californicum TaxID=61474 RepID=A0A7R9J949_TIMCA|nr:unnamed protein product [Timema californicum]
MKGLLPIAITVLVRVKKAAKNDRLKTATEILDVLESGDLSELEELLSDEESDNFDVTLPRRVGEPNPDPSEELYELQEENIDEDENDDDGFPFETQLDLPNEHIRVSPLSDVTITSKKDIKWRKHARFQPLNLPAVDNSTYGVEPEPLLIRIRSRKWTLKMIFHAVDLALTNSWLEYRHIAREHKVPTKEILDLLHFRQRVAEALIKTGKPTSSNQRKRGRPRTSNKDESVDSPPTRRPSGVYPVGFLYCSREEL